MLKTHRFSIHMYTQATIIEFIRIWKIRKRYDIGRGTCWGGGRSMGSWKWETIGEYDCRALYAWMKFSKEEWRNGREKSSYFTANEIFLHYTYQLGFVYNSLWKHLVAPPISAPPMLSIPSLKSVFVTGVSVSIVSNTVWFHSCSWNFLGHWHPLPWNCKALQKTASLKRGVACFLCGNPGQDWTCVHKRKCKQRFAQLIGSKIAEMASHYEQSGNQQMTRWC